MVNNTTPNLSITYLAQNQTNKEILVNEAFLKIDSLINNGAISISTITPPVSPNDSDLYIIPNSATGDWSGEDGKITYYNSAKGWVILSPNEGMTLWVNDEDKLYSFDGTSWVTSGEFDNLTELGVNATADSTNRLAVKSDAILFDNNGNNSQIKVNKATTADNAAHLFQTNYSGRAEFGLTGDDDFHIKVSPDGSNWSEAIVIDKNNAGITFKSWANFDDGSNIVKINNVTTKPIEIFDNNGNGVFNITNAGFVNALGCYNSTTAISSNMYINSAGGIFRSTSSIKYKKDVTDLSLETAKKLLKMRPVKYKSKSNNDKADNSYYGLIAEEVAAIDPRFVIFDENGNAEGIQYERLVVFIIKLLQEAMQTESEKQAL